MWKCFHCSWKHSWKHSLKPGHANKGTFAKICYRTFFSLTSVKKISFFYCSHTFSACTLPMWKKLSGFFDHSMTSSTFICYGYLTVLRSVISELWYGVKWCLRNVVLLMSMFIFVQTPLKDPKTGEMKDKVTAFIVERSFGGVSRYCCLSKNI